MLSMKIGDVIRNRRLELGITQQALCEGICDTPALSKIENGRQDPTKAHLDALLQRLGMSGERYYALVSKKDFMIQCLQQEIILLNAKQQKKEALKKISELEKLVKTNDRVLQQIILRSKMVAGKEDNGKITPYDAEYLLELLFQAIKLTIPNFDMEEVEKKLLNFEEVKIINHIAVVYSEIGERRKALDIYRQLFRYTKKHYVDLVESASITILVTYNYSKELGLVVRVI